MGRAGLRVISGAAAASPSELDGESFQAVCVDGFVASWTARGFSPVTIENGMGVLERFLDLLAVPAWEAGPEDVDRVVGELVARGAAASTRRGYVQAFKDFHRFLVARKAAEIEATFGVVLEDPVDEFNAARHVGNDSVSTRPPPTPQRMDEFFAFLRERVATARKYAPERSHRSPTAAGHTRPTASHRGFTPSRTRQPPPPRDNVSGQSTSNDIAHGGLLNLRDGPHPLREVLVNAQRHALSISLRRHLIPPWRCPDHTTLVARMQDI